MPRFLTLGGLSKLGDLIHIEKQPALAVADEFHRLVDILQHLDAVSPSRSCA